MVFENVRILVLRRSSVVERLAVNEMVAGSAPKAHPPLAENP